MSLIKIITLIFFIFKNINGKYIGLYNLFKHGQMRLNSQRANGFKRYKLWI